MPEALLRVGPVTVQFGHRVTIEIDGIDLIICIVLQVPVEDPAPDIDLMVKYITDRRPLGKAALRKAVGETFTYDTPSGPKQATVKKIDRGVSHGRK